MTEKEMIEKLAKVGATLKKFNKTAHEFDKLCRIAEARVRGFDRANAQPYKDHAFMEKLRFKFRAASDCGDMQDASDESLTEFGLEKGSRESFILHLFERYFYTK